MVSCSIKSCKSRSGILFHGKKLSYHRFPKDDFYKSKWLEVCPSLTNNLKNGKQFMNIHELIYIMLYTYIYNLYNKDNIIVAARICSIHFKETDFIEFPHLANVENYNPKNLRSLSLTAIPTENLNPSIPTLKNVTNKQALMYEI